MLFVLMVIQALCFTPAQTDDSKQLQGKWKVITILENGRSLNEQEIATQLVSDGHFTFDGMVVSFLPPGQFEPKKIPFVINDKAEPKAIDLMGAAKIGATGIYLLSGDSLMLTFPGVNEKTRPADFGNAPGSHRVLVVLQRAGAASKASISTTTSASSGKATFTTVANSQTRPQPPAAPSVMEDMKKQLIGTWGHQTEEAILYYTLNADGTFSSTVDWKSGLKNTFKSDQRTSGTWSLNNGVIIATITASTESNLRNQVYSWRVTNLGDRDLIAVDNQGRLRHEWKVR